MKRIILLVLCFLLIFMLCQPVLATSLEWTGAASDGSWHTADNWDFGKVPEDGDYVLIPEDSVVEYAYGETSVMLNCAGNLTVSGGTLKFIGNSFLRDGKLDVDGDITISGNGYFSWSGGSIEGSGKLIIEEFAKFSTKASSSLDRFLVNNGSLLINDSLTLTGGAEGSGNFNTQEDQTLKLGGSESYDLSTLNFSNMGTLKIANTCTSAQFNYDFTQHNTGTLEFDIGGLNDFTSLEVRGKASLKGVLKINILDGYVPQAGDSFEIMTYSSNTGTFSSIESNIPGITFVPTYTGTGLTLTVQGVTTVPSAPLNITLVVGDSQIKLSWAAPASDGGSEIIRYEVMKDGDAEWTDVGLETSYTFTGLTNGEEYTFKVRAVNDVGAGEPASIKATPEAEPVITHTVNFYSNGSLYASRTVISGYALEDDWPDNPTRSGSVLLPGCSYRHPCRLLYPWLQ
jgi:hypothetical protein